MKENSVGDQAAKPLITVLGSSGFVGTAIARELAGRPLRLRLVGRRPTVIPPQPTAEIDMRLADLTTPGAVADAVAGADAVIHLVAHIAGAGNWRVSSDDPVAERINLGLVHDLVDALRTKRPHRPPFVVLAGSTSQAGRSTAARGDDSASDLTLSTYDLQKLEAERIIRDADTQGLLRGSTLRLSTLYTRGTDSPALDRGVVSTMMRRAFADQPLTMWHDGTVKRDLLCVDDVARAFLATLDHADAAAGRPWTVGTGEATSIADLFTMIAKTVAVHTGRPPVPVVSVPPAEHSTSTDLVDFVFDPSEFQHATGWAPRVPLSAGLDSLAAAMVRDTAPGRR